MLLVKKDVTVDVGCEVRGEGSETIIHCLRDCVFAANVWFCAGFKDWAGLKNKGDVLDWLMTIWVTMSEAALQLCTVVAWRAFGLIAIVTFVVGARRMRKMLLNLLWGILLNICRLSMVLMFLQGVKGRVDGHLHPVDGVYKLDFDGATFEDGSAGTGVAVRDYRGEIIASCVRHLFDYSDIDHVEVLAARRAVVFAVELGLSRIHLKVDSLWIITAIQSCMEDLSAIGAIVLLFELELLSYW